MFSMLVTDKINGPDLTNLGHLLASLSFVTWPVLLFRLRLLSRRALMPAMIAVGLSSVFGILGLLGSTCGSGDGGGREFCISRWCGWNAGVFSVYQEAEKCPDIGRVGRTIVAFECMDTSVLNHTAKECP
jgi:hypothetical protein